MNMNRYFKTILGCLIGSMSFSCSSTENGVEPVVPTQPTVSDVAVLTTTNNRSQDLAASTLAFSTKSNMSPYTITLDPATTYQTIDGFGAAITGSTCYNLMQMKPADRTKFLTQTFSVKEGYGFSYVRVSIGCSDFSLSLFTCCDTKGIENFALTEEDTKYVIPILKEIVAINPDLKIMGSPWSCPRWMKVTDVSKKIPYVGWTGGHLNPDYYQDYATYFVKWIQAFKANGINIYSITPQNEPENPYNCVSLLMPWEEERDFVKTALGPALQQAGLGTKIYIYDHNYDDPAYATSFLADADASKYVAGSAFHDYGGDRSALNTVHAAFPAKDVVFTESSIGTWNNGRDLSDRLLADMENITLGTVNNWSKGAIVWNLMLDIDRGPNQPNGGCSTCYGAVDISKDYATITRNSHYYIMAQMAAVARTGAVRIGTKGYTASGLTYTAFKNTDGSYALVLCNNSDETRSITVADATHHFITSVTPRSIVSLKW